MKSGHYELKDVKSRLTMLVELEKHERYWTLRIDDAVLPLFKEMLERGANEVQIDVEYSVYKDAD